MPDTYSIEEMTGKAYGRWTVLGGLRKQSARPKSPKQTLCQCECGTKRWVQVTALRNGRSQSCGCRAKEMHSRMIQRYAPLPKSFTSGAAT
jgi:hypothetical protein